MSSAPISPVVSTHPKAFLWQYVLIVAFVLLFSVLLFTFFHEAGHALVGLLFGAKITSFSVDFIGMSAHVGLDASFTPVQQAFVSLAGFSLPFMLDMIFLLSAPRRGSALLEYVKLLTSVISISSLLAWVVLPWLYLAGERPGDDSITFIINTGIYPPLVSIGAGLIFALGLCVFLGRMEGARGILARLRVKPAEFVTPAARRTLAGLVLVFGVVAGLAFGLGLAFGTSKMSFLIAPTDYTPAATIHLFEHALAGEPVYSFTLEQPSSVSLFFAMNGLTRGPGTISMTGPEGYENIFFKADEKVNGNFTVHPKDLKLAAGQYQVRLTFPQDPGVLEISQKIEMAQPVQAPGK
jgi:hypothetical protein